MTQDIESIGRIRIGNMLEKSGYDKLNIISSLVSITSARQIINQRISVLKNSEDHLFEEVDMEDAIRKARAVSRAFTVVAYGDKFVDAMNVRNSKIIEKGIDEQMRFKLQGHYTEEDIAKQLAKAAEADEEDATLSPEKRKNRYMSRAIKLIWAGWAATAGAGLVFGFNPVTTTATLLTSTGLALHKGFQGWVSDMIHNAKTYFKSVLEKFIRPSSENIHARLVASALKKLHPMDDISKEQNKTLERLANLIESKDSVRYGEIALLKGIDAKLATMESILVKEFNDEHDYQVSLEKSKKEKTTHIKVVEKDEVHNVAISIHMKDGHRIKPSVVEQNNVFENGNMGHNSRNKRTVKTLDVLIDLHIGNQEILQENMPNIQNRLKDRVLESIHDVGIMLQKGIKEFEIENIPLDTDLSTSVRYWQIGIDEALQRYTEEERLSFGR